MKKLALKLKPYVWISLACIVAFCICLGLFINVLSAVGSLNAAKVWAGNSEMQFAQLAVFEFVKSAIAVIFLLNRRYQPYYKWSFRALRGLPLLSLEAELLEYLLTTGNEAETAEEKYNVVEGIAADVIDELMAGELTAANCGDLEKHAYSVNDRIADAGLRNMHILAAV